MNLIVETDLGHDPDDLFTLLYLVAAGINIQALLITPGDLDQIAMAYFLCRELNLNIPVYGAKHSDKMSSGGVHHDMLKKYNRPFQEKGITANPEVIERLIIKSPDCEFLVIGPPKITGMYFAQLHHNDRVISRLTMQGGFLSYNLTSDILSSRRLSKFEGRYTCPTFNMNGAVKETETIVSSRYIIQRQFVGKNVCHRILFDKSWLSCYNKPNSRAAELFIEAANLYFNKHQDKKFHDPLAAFLHLHPEYGKWVTGKPFRKNGEWGTMLVERGDKILFDVDEDAFWEHLTRWE